MEAPSRSIADHIESLARLTGAPRAFVVQVRELFERKGISLESDAAPYARALDEAFTRERSIRSDAGRSRDGFDRIRRECDRVGRRFVQRVVAASSGSRRTEAETPDDDEPEETIELARPDPRAVVVGIEREALPLVHGPELTS
jgi:hypothetical protein